MPSASLEGGKFHKFFISMDQRGKINSKSWWRSCWYTRAWLQACVPGEWTKEDSSDWEKEGGRVETLYGTQTKTTPAKQSPIPSIKILNTNISSSVIHSTTCRKRASEKMKIKVYRLGEALLWETMRWIQEYCLLEIGSRWTEEKEKQLKCRSTRERDAANPLCTTTTIISH